MIGGHNGLFVLQAQVPPSDAAFCIPVSLKQRVDNLNDCLLEIAIADHFSLDLEFDGLICRHNLSIEASRLRLNKHPLGDCRQRFHKTNLQIKGKIALNSWSEEHGIIFEGQNCRVKNKSSPGISHI